MALPVTLLAADVWQLAASIDQPARLEGGTGKVMDAN
jgi:hypothetical protein